MHSPDTPFCPISQPTTVGTDRGFEMNAALGFYSKAPDTRGRFNENNKKVLRFECVWDDRGRPFGDLQLLALHYYLEDETVEAVVRTGTNAGRGAGAKLLSRGRVPVAGTGLADAKEEEEDEEGSPGEDFGKGGASRAGAAGGSPGKGSTPPRSREQRAAGGYKKGPGSWAGTFVSPITGIPMYASVTGRTREADSGAAHQIEVDSRGVPVAPIDHVTPDLLRVGTTFMLYGKRLTIRRADEFTQRWYAENLGVDQSSPADGPRGDIAGQLSGSKAARAGVAAAAAVTGGTFMGGSARHALSAGLGSADTVSSAARRAGGPWDRAKHAGKRPEVVPFDGMAALGDEEETRRNMDKLVPTFRHQKDIERLYRRGGKVMRFLGRLVGPRAEVADEARVFVVNFHLEDDTVSVFEQAASNSGFSKGAFLDRGRYRNLNAEPDNFGQQAGDRTQELEAEMAGLGRSTLRAIATDPLASTARREAATAQLRAAERRFGGMGHRFGYDQGTGQGQIVTAFAKEDRVAAGPTGVARARGVGIRERSRFVPPPRHFRASDFALGEEIEFAHSPGQRFRLLDCDEFTRQYMQDSLGMVEDAVDPTKLPVSEADSKFRAMAMGVVTKPGAWIAGRAASAAEGGSGGGSPGRGKGAPAEPTAAVRRQQLLASRPHTGRVGRVLLGCVQSLRQYMRRSDRMGKGFVSLDDALSAMASYGAGPPAVKDADVTRVLSDHAVTRQRRQRQRYSAPAGGSPGQGDADAGDDTVVLGVAYDSLCDVLARSQEMDITRTAREERVIQQLRSSLLSSRTHARRLFRELGRRVPGCITRDEFRMLLRRHHLDVGFEEEDVEAIMERFPAADIDSKGGYAGSAVSWRGFVETLLGAEDGSVEPEEVEEYIRFVAGIGKPLEDGAGTAPEVYEHRPRGSAWGLDPFNEKEVAAYRDRREGFKGVLARESVRDAEAEEEASAAAAAEDAERTVDASDIKVEDVDDDGEDPANESEADWYAAAARADRARLPIGVASSPMAPHTPKTAFADENGVAVDPEEGPVPPPAGQTVAGGTTREQVLERLRKFFRFRGAQLRRVLSLYGRPSRGLITLDSAANAIESAGFELRLDEREALLPGCTGPSGREDTVRTEELLVEVLGTSFTM